MSTSCTHMLSLRTADMSLAIRIPRSSITSGVSKLFLTGIVSTANISLAIRTPSLGITSTVNTLFLIALVSLYSLCRPVSDNFSVA